MVYRGKEEEVVKKITYTNMHVYLCRLFLEKKKEMRDRHQLINPLRVYGSAHIMSILLSLPPIPSHLALSAPREVVI